MNCEAESGACSLHVSAAFVLADVSMRDTDGGCGQSIRLTARLLETAHQVEHKVKSSQVESSDDKERKLSTTDWTTSGPLGPARPRVFGREKEMLHNDSIQSSS